MEEDGWRDIEVLPGYKTHPDMDVDFVIVIMEDGTVKFFFIPGKMKGTGRSKYRIGANGVPYPIDGGLFVTSHSPTSFSWVQTWWSWMIEASKTGFPNGYEPSQSTSEKCVWRPTPHKAFDWPKIFPGWNKTYELPSVLKRGQN